MTAAEPFRDHRAFATSIAVSSCVSLPLLQCFSREFNRKLRHNAIVLQHASLPRQIRGNREAKNVSVANLDALPLTLKVGAGQTDKEYNAAEERRRGDLRDDSRSDANYFFWAAGLAAVGSGLLPVRLTLLSASARLTF